MTAPRVTPRIRTALNPGQERIFRLWYADWANKAGLDPNPDSPLQMYDYRGAFLNRAEPTIAPEDGLYHWPSQFKDDDHPNRFVPGVGDSKAIDSAGAQMMVSEPKPVMPKMSLGRMKRRALAGKPIPGDDDYTED